MRDSETQPVAVRTALEEVITTSRQLVVKRLDLLQVEAESLVDDVAARMMSACAAVVLACLALTTGSVALIAWATPTYGLAGAAGLVCALYSALAAACSLFASHKRAQRRTKVSP